MDQRFCQQLECPVCYQYYTPPVYICLNDHSIYNSCSCHSRTCPICRSLIPRSSRNLTLESLLQNVWIPCRYEGCLQQVSLANRLVHKRVCKFNNLLNCPECNSQEEDLVGHLNNVHEYKEMIMDQRGGIRSFSGPSECWNRDTDWPKGIWRFGALPIIVHAKNVFDIFHVYLYKLEQSDVRIELFIQNQQYQMIFRGQIPFVTEIRKKSNYPHFNCEVLILLSNFVKVHYEDNEILRLWVSANLI